MRKSKVLAYIEYRTAAIYHASNDALRALDKVQDNFLEELGVNAVDSIVHFSLAPLRTRRDISMLGVLFRTYKGQGPRQCRDFFSPPEPRLEGEEHAHRFASHRRGLTDWAVLERSALGLIDVWNLLPGALIKNAANVKAFQSALQRIVVERAKAGMDEWADIYSPRLSLISHPFAPS